MRLDCTTPDLLRTLGSLLVLATGAMLLATGCSRPSEPAPKSGEAAPRIAVQPVSHTFLGNAECAECHPKETTAHAHSRHAATLHTMNKQSLGPLAPPEGRIPNTIFALKTQGDKYWVGLAANPGKADTIDLAFGSGKTGMTYVAAGRDALAEVRMSYFPHRKEWYVTLGQEQLRDQKLGRIHRGEFARRCVQCHSVTVPAERLIPEPKFMGVGCESCHGPGGEHAAAMRAGKREARLIDRPSRADAAQVNALCNRCHSSGQPITPEELERSPSATRRFPVYALQKSRCFQQSNNTLSCLTCHDPHTDARTDHASYDAICLQCHRASSETPKASSPSPVVGKSCPINARTGCIDCHMPLGKLLPETNIPLQTRDHFIHIERAAATEKE